MLGALVLHGWVAAEKAVQAAVDIPIDPFHGRVLDIVQRSQCPGAERAGVWGRIRTMTRVVSARLSRRYPSRLSLCRCVFPDDAGTGQVPAAAAKAASDRTRPGCDHAVVTEAATTEPTPGSSHSSGATFSMMASRLLRLSGSSASRAMMRLANRIASCRQVLTTASSMRSRHGAMILS